MRARSRNPIRSVCSSPSSSAVFLTVSMLSSSSRASSAVSVGRVHVDDVARYKPIEEHSQRGQVLLHGGRGKFRLQLLHKGGDVDGAARRRAGRWRVDRTRPQSGGLTFVRKPVRERKTDIVNDDEGAGKPVPAKGAAKYADIQGGLARWWAQAGDVLSALRGSRLSSTLYETGGAGAVGRSRALRSAHRCACARVAQHR